MPDEIEVVQTQSGRQIFETLERSRKAGFDAMGAALAHELNQPLAALTLYLQSLSKRLERDPPADPMLRELADKASSEAQRAGDIVRRMRRLSLRAEPELQPIDLNALARECAEAALSASARRAELRVRFDPSLPAVLADPVQIRQVILNLLRNAAEATARVALPSSSFRRRAGAIPCVFPSPTMVRASAATWRPSFSALSRRANRTEWALALPYRA